MKMKGTRSTDVPLSTISGDDLTNIFQSHESSSLIESPTISDAQDTYHRAEQQDLEDELRPSEEPPSLIQEGPGDREDNVDIWRWIDSIDLAAEIWNHIPTMKSVPHRMRPDSGPTE